MQAAILLTSPKHCLTGAAVGPEALICSTYSNGFISAFVFPALCTFGHSAWEKLLVCDYKACIVNRIPKGSSGGSIFLRLPPCNIAANPRATRDSKIPTTRKRQLSLLLRSCANNCGEGL